MRNRDLTKYLRLVMSLAACLGLLAGSVLAANDGHEPEIRFGPLDISWTYSELAEISDLDRPLEPLDTDQPITWHLYVPETYHSAEPAGLMVYISPTQSGGMRSDWQSVMESENLIWISARDSGNQVPTRRRILLAALAPFVAADQYAIDPDRVYLSGFSGGGKAAGIASINLASLFRGAIFMCGAEFWPGVESQHIFVAAKNRYVFLTGSRDFNRTLTRQTLKKYRNIGLRNTKLIVVRGLDHELPDPENFRKAIRFLDQRQ
jgi:hypothetical protein